MTILESVTATDAAIAVDDRYVAHNYSPLPVVAASAEGAWIIDVEGRRYLDCLAAYSAVNFGHRHPEIIATAHAQLDTVPLVSRAFHSDRLGPFADGWVQVTGAVTEGDEVVILIVGRKVGNKLIVEGEEFHGHQDHSTEPSTDGPGKDAD